ncbi:MAG: glycosyltransferase family 39 protein [Candidatus Omnitrophota bacterium]
MNSSPTKNLFFQPKVWLIAIIALSALLLFFRPGARSLWEPDEGRFAEITREMVESGDWLTPRNNYIKHFDKPPVLFWLIGSSFLLFGQNEAAAHLPLSILSLLGVLATFSLGTELFNRRTGFIAALILATSAGYGALSRLLSTDIVLTVLCILSYLCFVRKKYFWLYLTLGIAFMTKGPIIFVLSLIPMIIFLIYTKDWARLKQMRLGWGLLFTLAIALPWFIYQVSRNERLFYDWTVQQTYNRIARPMRSPIYFFIPVLCGLFFPHIFFLIPAFKKYFSLKRVGLAKEQAATLLVLIWFFLPFVFFSFAVKKLVTYMLPLLPALSLFLARLWDEALEDQKITATKIFSWAHLLFIVILGLLAIAPLGFLASGQAVKLGVSAGQANMVAMSAIFTLGLIGGIRLFRRNNIPALFMLIIGVATLFLLNSIDVLPRIEDATGRSMKTLALTIKQDLKPEDKVVTYRCFLSSLPFYLQRRVIVVERQRNIAYEETEHWRDYLLKDKAALYQLLSSPGIKVYCITYTWEYDQIAQEYPQPLERLGQAGKYVLFRNK